MTEIAMRREGSHLVAVDPMSAEMIAEIPTNVDLLVTVTTPRNVKQFKKAWVLAQKVSEACDWLHDRVDAMDWMLIKARHVRTIQDTNNGELIVMPKSIRWASLGQDAFNRIHNRMIHVVTTQIIPGLDEGALRAEIEALIFDPTKPEESKPERKQRKPRAPLEKISVIPDRLTEKEIHDRAQALAQARAIETAESQLLRRDIISHEDNGLSDDWDRAEMAREEFVDENDESQPLDTSAPNPAERKEVQTTSIDSSEVVSGTVPESDPGAQVQFTLQPFYDKKFNITDWSEWTKAWLMAALIDMSVTDQDVMTRWNNERTLRNECGVTTEDRQPMFDLYTKTIKRIRNRRKI